MMNLKYHPAEMRGLLDPIPFPRQSWMPGRDQDSPRSSGAWSEGAPTYRFGARTENAASMAENALDRAQRQMDRLKELLGSDLGPDRPSAA